MGKPVVVGYEGVESRFELTKLDRSMLYGSRKRVALDETGALCTKAQLALNGKVLIRSGMTAQGYFATDGTWVPNKKMIGLDNSGNPLQQTASTLGVTQNLEGPVSAKLLLDLEVESVFILSPAEIDARLKTELDDGKLFKAPFSYGADYRQKTSIIFGNTEGYFLAVGMPIEAEWCEIANVVIPEEDESNDELDFDML